MAEFTADDAGADDRLSYLKAHGVEVNQLSQPLSRSSEIGGNVLLFFFRGAEEHRGREAGRGIAGGTDLHATFEVFGGGGGLLAMFGLCLRC